MKKLSKIGLLALGLLTAGGQTSVSACCGSADDVAGTARAVSVLAVIGEIVGGALTEAGKTGNPTLVTAGNLTTLISQSVGNAATRVVGNGNRTFTAPGFEKEVMVALTDVASFIPPRGVDQARAFKVTLDLKADGSGRTQLFWPDLAGEVPLFDIDFDRVSAVLAATPTISTLQRNDYTKDEQALVKAQFDAYDAWATANPIEVVGVKMPKVRLDMVALLRTFINTVATLGYSGFTEFANNQKAYLSLTNGETDAADTRFATIYLPNPPATPAAS